MLKISAQLASVLEAQGRGKFSVQGRTITFTGNDGRSALWSAPSKTHAEIWVGAWRRGFSRDELPKEWQ